jgi:hypothetical protein
MRALTVLFVLLAVPLRAATAQTSPAEIHDFVAQFMAQDSMMPLPPGDTLVSWSNVRAVLFHTGSRDPGGVRAGVLRMDGLRGIVDVRWVDGAPKSFLSLWLRLDDSTNVLETSLMQGEVGPDGLRITRAGAPDTLVAIPSGRWAVADYGMESLLLPAFDDLPRSSPASGSIPDSSSTLMVFRPFGMKWDALTVFGEMTGPGWRLIPWTDVDDVEWIAVARDSHLLFVGRYDRPDDATLALENTEARRALDEILPAIGEIGRASCRERVFQPV